MSGEIITNKDAVVVRDGRGGEGESYFEFRSGRDDSQLEGRGETEAMTAKFAPWPEISLL